MNRCLLVLLLCSSCASPVVLDPRGQWVVVTDLASLSWDGRCEPAIIQPPGEGELGEVIEILSAGDRGLALTGWGALDFSTSETGFVLRKTQSWVNDSDTVVSGHLREYALDWVDDDHLEGTLSSWRSAAGGEPCTGTHTVTAVRL